MNNIDGKKIAKILRTHSTVIIQRKEGEEKNLYWLSNTHFLVLLEKEDYLDFYNTYNQYKSTADIPELKPGEGARLLEQGEFKKQEFLCESMLNYNSKKVEKLVISPIKVNQKNRDLRLLKPKDTFSFNLYINEEYLPFLEYQEGEIYSEGPLNPVYLVDIDEYTGEKRFYSVVMPVRIDENDIEFIERFIA